MSRLFPNTTYAEDQPLAHIVLTTHVLHRGLQVGATTGIATSTVAYWYRTSRSGMKLHTVSKSGNITSMLRSVIYPTFSQTFLKHVGAGSVVGATLLSAALASKMYGKDDIEWRDRSWRLLQNRGQLEVDDWSVAGALMGAALATTRRTGLRQIVGITMIGNVVGVVGYLGWRYGVRTGRGQHAGVFIETVAPATEL